MRLTRLQRRNLEFSRRFRDVPLTLSALLLAMKTRYLIGAVYFGASAILVGWVWGVYPAILLGVSFATLLLRDFGTFRRTVQIWPVQRLVIDWEKLDKLLTADDESNAVSPPIA